MKLIQYRDGQMEDYTYFWTVDEIQVSPFFTDEVSAQDWLSEQIDTWDNWKASKDIV